MATLVNAGFDPAELVARLSVVPRGISADSRLVRPGDVFAAYRGQAADGRAFIPDAIARGADAVLWDAFGFRWNPAWEVANLAVDDLKAKLGAIASFIYGNPSRSLWVAGVTGTNGKTSCSHWIAQCLERVRPARRDHRHARQRPRRRSADLDAHDAGCRARPCDARADARRRRARGRDGGLVACARPGSRQRRRVRRRAFHQSDPRSSRLPRDDGGVRDGKVAPVHLARTRHARDQCRRPVRPESCRSCTRPPAEGAHVRAGQRRHRRHCDRHHAGRDPHVGRHAMGQRRSRRASRRDVQRGEHARCSRRAARGRDRARRRSRCARAHHGAAGPDAATRRRIRAARRRRLRAFARRSRKSVDRAAPDSRRRRRVDLRIRMRRRSRCGQAPGHGADRGAPCRSRDRHQRQPARGGSGCDRRRGRSRHSRRRPFALDARARSRRRDPRGDRVGARRRRRADRRQGSRGLPGNEGRAYALFRCRSRDRGACGEWERANT